MSSEPQLFRINLESQQSERIEEVDFARLGLQERKDIQEWIAANPSRARAVKNNNPFFENIYNIP
jgi:hypothetical protein